MSQGCVLLRINIYWDSIADNLLSNTINNLLQSFGLFCAKFLSYFIHYFAILWIFIFLQSDIHRASLLWGTVLWQATAIITWSISCAISLHLRLVQERGWFILTEDVSTWIVWDEMFEQQLNDKIECQCAKTVINDGYETY